MGVDIHMKNFAPTRHDGTTSCSHGALVKTIEDSVVAIDGALWQRQAHQTSGNNSRFEMMLNAAHGDWELAHRRNIIQLFVDRCLQLLRYGAHPVVVRTLAIVCSTSLRQPGL
jgi:superfamily I DNA and RNA helicase